MPNLPKNAVGRPSKGDFKRVAIATYLAPDDAKRVVAAADADGMQVSIWLRRLVLARLAQLDSQGNSSRTREAV